MHLEKLSEHTLNVPSPNQGAELERNGTGCCDENVIIFGGPPRLLLYKKESNHCFQFLNGGSFLSCRAALMCLCIISTND